MPHRPPSPSERVSSGAAPDTPPAAPGPRTDAAPHRETAAAPGIGRRRFLHLGATGLAALGATVPGAAAADPPEPEPLGTAIRS